MSIPKFQQIIFPVSLDKVIHMAFFKMSKEERVGRMSGYKRRREYRI